VLWQPPPGEGGNSVEVDSVLTKWLRPHQRDGVQFMFECVMGMRQKSGAGAGLSSTAHLAAHVDVLQTPCSKPLFHSIADCCYATQGAFWRMTWCVC